MIILWSCKYEWLQKYIVWLKFRRGNTILWHKVWAFKGTYLKYLVQINSLLLHSIICLKFCHFSLIYVYIMTFLYRSLLSVSNYLSLFYSSRNKNIFLMTTKHTSFFNVLFIKFAFFLRIFYLKLSGFQL